jgi:hypothetical protein
MVSRSVESIGHESWRGRGLVGVAWGILTLVACGAATGCAAAYDCYRSGCPATAYRPHPPLPHAPLYRPLEPSPATAACGSRPALER